MQKTILLSTAILVVVMSGASPPGQSPTWGLWEEPRECPHNWDSVFVVTRKADPIVVMPGLPSWFPGEITNVPEFHDCQRFIEVTRLGERSYIGRFAIFADHRLDSLELRLDTLHVSQPCPGVKTCPGAGVVTTALPAALIIAEAPYEPLRITQFGAYCLLLYRDSNRWRAKIVFMGTDVPVPIDCQSDVDATEIGTELTVKARTESSLPDDGHYPPVARWDWDYAANQHYIGIKCGAAWCEVGNPGGFTSSPVRPEFVQAPDAASRRTVRIKGWFDEQYLAIPSVGGWTRPSNILGRIFPDPNLGDLNRGDSFDGRWVRVARVSLEVGRARFPSMDPRNPLGYGDKYNFHLTDGLDRLNEIELCAGDRKACRGVPREVSDSCRDTIDPPWWARVRGARDRSGDPYHYVCVKRFPVGDGNIRIPGTVRWRWLASDEGGWIRCIQGCCEMSGVL